jgi:hypothetical protein
MPQHWQRNLLRKLKRWAQERFPVNFPVRVYLRSGLKDVNGHDLLGYFLLGDDDDRGVIAISDKQDLTGIVDTFTEEWAHARTAYLIDTHDDDDDPDHHASFWAEYGRIQKAARERQW